MTAAALRRDGLVRRNPAVGDSGSGGRGLFVFGVPGAVFVVGGVVAQAAVEDADEPVRDGPECLVVGCAAGSLSVSL